jgi:hypothetical protein
VEDVYCFSKVKAIVSIIKIGHDLLLKVGQDWCECDILFFHKIGHARLFKVGHSLQSHSEKMVPFKMRQLVFRIYIKHILNISCTAEVWFVKERATKTKN